MIEDVSAYRVTQWQEPTSENGALQVNRHGLQFLLERKDKIEKNQ